MKTRQLCFLLSFVAALLIASGCATSADYYKKMDESFRSAVPAMKSERDFDLAYAKAKEYAIRWVRKDNQSNEVAIPSLLDLVTLEICRFPAALGFALKSEALNADIGTSKSIAKDEYWIGCALESGSVEFARLLAGSGYDFSKRLRRINFRYLPYLSAYSGDRSPLEIMAVQGKRDTLLCALLKDHYRDQADRLFGLAILNKRIDTVLALSSAFPSAVDFVDPKWGGAIHFAVVSGDVGMVDTVIRLDAPDVKNGSLGYATDFAWRSKSLDIVARLRASNYKAEWYLPQIENMEARYAAEKAEKMRIIKYKTGLENMVCIFALKLTMPNYWYSDTSFSDVGMTRTKTTTTHTITGSVRTHYLIGYKDGSVCLYSPYRFDLRKMDYDQMTNVPEGKALDRELYLSGRRLVDGKNEYDSNKDHASSLFAWTTQIDEKDPGFALIRHTHEATRKEWLDACMHAGHAVFSVEVARLL